MRPLRDSPSQGRGAGVPPRASGRMRRFGRDRAGVTAIEFAILAVPFLMIVFATLETAAAFLAELTLDHAVQRVSRLVRVGEIRSGDEAKFKSALCANAKLLLSCDDIKYDLRSYPSFGDIPTAAPVSDGTLASGGFGFEPGGAEAVTALRVYYEWPIFTDLIRRYIANTADGAYLLSSVSVFKTEPYE